MIRTITAGVAALLLSGALAFAAPADVHEVTQAKLELAHQVMAAAHVMDTMKRLEDAVLQPMLNMSAKADGLPEDLRQPLIDDFRESFERRLPALLDRTANIYAQEFSEDELKAILAFYQSPAGQAFVDKAAGISQQTSAIGRDLGREAGVEAAERLCREHDCSRSVTKPAKP